MVNIRSGTVIREPWISMILRSEKTWELRSKRTPKRGRVALIRKRSGLIVGLATITGVLGPFEKDQFADHFDKHKVPKNKIEKARYAWILDDVVALERPIKYIHGGGVTWVNLDPAASEQASAIDQLLRRDGASV